MLIGPSGRGRCQSRLTAGQGRGPYWLSSSTASSRIWLTYSSELHPPLLEEAPRFPWTRAKSGLLWLCHRAFHISSCPSLQPPWLHSHTMNLVLLKLLFIYSFIPSTFTEPSEGCRGRSCEQDRHDPHLMGLPSSRKDRHWQALEPGCLGLSQLALYYLLDLLKKCFLLEYS